MSGSKALPPEERQQLKQEWNKMSPQKKNQIRQQHQAHISHRP